MRVLGLSYNSHDASAAVAEDGCILVAAAEERFTRLKHDPNFPQFAARSCLDKAGMSSAEDLDSIVYYEQPTTRFSRVLTANLAGFPSSRRAFVHDMKSWLSTRLWVQNEISRQLKIDGRAIEFISHYKSLASQAFLTSPFDEAAILIVESVGEWDCTCLALASAKPNFELRQLESIPYPHSLGLLYSAFTSFLGFRPNDEESTVTALAAFGQAVFADKFSKVLKTQSSGLYEVDPSYFNFVDFDRNPFTSKLIELFGPPRSTNAELPLVRDPQRSAEKLTPDQQRYADIAASLQYAIEEALLGLAHRLFRLTGSSNLCLSGRLALNCAANERLRKESPFKDIYIPADPDEGGGAAGAALWAGASETSRRSPGGMDTPFLGIDYGTGTLIATVHDLESVTRVKDAVSGSRLTNTCLSAKEFEDESKLISAVVDELISGRVVGWFQGRFESCPRGLGNRSILVDPSNEVAVKRLSASVKRQAAFRPYALSITDADCLQVFEWDNSIPRGARWMQLTASVKSSSFEKVRGAVHVNFTTLPQVVSNVDNRIYYSLLRSFGDATGLGALLTASFSERGYPIVSSPNDALIMFLRTSMDVLVVNNVLIRKETLR